MKAQVTFNVDVGLLKAFSDTLKQKLEYPDDVIERFMQDYVNGSDSDDPYVRLTKELLDRCKESMKVGQLAKIVLRKLLESGVASEEEVIEMQKASGNVQIKNYHTTFGRYNNSNFKTSFPLLITSEQKEKYDSEQKKFLVNPLTIYGQEYHLSAQWYDYNRAPMENWIISHLPKWFETATEEQKANMIKFIKNR